MNLYTLRKWMRVYAFCLALLTLVLGAVLCAQAIDLYLSGTALDNIGENGLYAQPIYTWTNVSERLNRVAWLARAWLAAALAGMMLWSIIPANSAKTVKSEPEAALRRLLKRPAADIPGAVRAEEKRRKIALIIGVAVCSACAVICLIYLLGGEQYAAREFETDKVLALARVIRNLLMHILPWVLLSFITALSVSAYCKRRAMCALKLITPQTSIITQIPKARARIGNRARFAVRLLLFAAALAFILLGVFNGGMKDVLYKAIQICSECIGLG